MNRPELVGVHHLKVAVSDVPRSRTWYERALELKVVHEFPDESGVVRGVAGTVPGLGSTMLALRENHDLAVTARGFDPIAFAVADLGALNAWADYLDEQQIAHTPVVQAMIGWLIALDDPDGTHILLYSTVDATSPTMQPS